MNNLKELYFIKQTLDFSEKTKWHEIPVGGYPYLVVVLMLVIRSGSGFWNSQEVNHNE